ncbi:MAG: hypothetical protein VKO64_07420 [Candidatus Sericytochromatia bacterium]|nr:hypothetical protein [Candidatus Sericytochromatia bacterium]
MSVRDHLDRLGKLIVAQKRGENVRVPESFRPAAEGLSGQDISLAEVRKHLVFDLARPRRIRQGVDTFDCGPATAQGVIARQQPGEYARLAIDLATRGEAKTRSGHSLSVDLDGAGNTLTTHQYGQLMKSIMDGNLGNAQITSGSERRRLSGVVREALDSGSVPAAIRTSDASMGHAVQIL